MTIIAGLCSRCARPVDEHTFFVVKDGQRIVLDNPQCPRRKVVKK